MDICGKCFGTFWHSHGAGFRSWIRSVDLNLRWGYHASRPLAYFIGLLMLSSTYLSPVTNLATSVIKCCTHLWELEWQIYDEFTRKQDKKYLGVRRPLRMCTLWRDQTLIYTLTIRFCSTKMKPSQQPVITSAECSLKPKTAVLFNKWIRIFRKLCDHGLPNLDGTH